MDSKQINGIKFQALRYLLNERNDLNIHVYETLKSFNTPTDTGITFNQNNIELNSHLEKLKSNNVANQFKDIPLTKDEDKIKSQYIKKLNNGDLNLLAKTICSIYHNHNYVAKIRQKEGALTGKGKKNIPFADKIYDYNDIEKIVCYCLNDFKENQDVYIEKTLEFVDKNINNPEVLLTAQKLSARMFKGSSRFLYAQIETLLTQEVYYYQYIDKAVQSLGKYRSVIKKSTQ